MPAHPAVRPDAEPLFCFAGLAVADFFLWVAFFAQGLPHGTGSACAPGTCRRVDTFGRDRSECVVPDKTPRCAGKGPGQPGADGGNCGLSEPLRAGGENSSDSVRDTTAQMVFQWFTFYCYSIF